MLYEKHDNTATIKKTKEIQNKLFELSYEMKRQDIKDLERYKDLEKYFEDELTPIEQMEFEKLKVTVELKIKYKIV